MVIAINPGHDRWLDPGACGERFREADIVDDVARMVVAKLQTLGHNVHYVQANELADISAAATESGAEIFVSIHCNAAENRAAEGTETWYYPDSASKKLADCLQQNVVEALHTEDRGCKNGDWIAVLRNTEVTATALVELGFISNAEEEEMLACSINDAADGIVDGIVAYIEQGMIENE